MRELPQQANAVSALQQLVTERRATEADGHLLDLLDELGLPAPLADGAQLPSAALAELRQDER